MKKQYRSRIGLVLDILRTLDELGEATITDLITYVNVPYDRLKKLLAPLEGEGYVRKKKEGRKVIYMLTWEGRKFLGELSKIEKIFKNLGINV